MSGDDFRARLYIPHHFVQLVAEQAAGKTLVGFDSRSVKKAKRPVVKIPEASAANKPSANLS